MLHSNSDSNSSNSFWFILFESNSSKAKLQFEISHFNASSHIMSALLNLISAILKTPISLQFLFFIFHLKVSLLHIPGPGARIFFPSFYFLFHLLSILPRPVLLLVFFSNFCSSCFIRMLHLPSAGQSGNKQYICWPTIVFP